MTAMPSSTSGRFDAAVLGGLDEPVRRYFTHALTNGAQLARSARLRLGGAIKVGVWLRFESVWEGDARGFSWRATCGPGPLRPLRVHDQFADRVGFMDIRLRPPLRRLPELKLLHVENEDTARSGAGRAALEALWVPGALLPDRGLAWRAEADNLIVASWDVPPERPELHISIGSDGAVTSYRAQRWRDSKSGYVPFGVDVHAERTFAGATIPSSITAGWGHGTSSWAPFFTGQIIAVERLDERPAPLTVFLDGRG
jgi:hypothetical protein